MFYAQFVLSKKGPLAKIWLAAHWEKKLSKAQIYETNVQDAVDEILKPKVKMALRTTGHLLLGIVRIYSRKTKYLLADCNEAFLKIKMAFRPGQIELLDDDRDPVNTKKLPALPEVFTDFDTALPDFNDNDFAIQINQSRLDDITLKEDLIPDNANYNTEFGMDDFGESAFGGDFGAAMDHDFGDFADESNHLEEQRLSRGSLGIEARETTPFIDGTAAPSRNLFADDDFGGGGAMEDDIDIGFGEGQPMEMDDELTLGAAASNIQGEQESFALEPLEPGALDRPRRAARKRRLIIDEQKNINGDEMKNNMSDFTDTLQSLDLAPPTRKLMRMKEAGTVEKLFQLPGCSFLKAKPLVKLYQSHLIMRARVDKNTPAAADIRQDLCLSDCIEDDREEYVDDFEYVDPLPALDLQPDSPPAAMAELEAQPEESPSKEQPEDTGFTPDKRKRKDRVEEDDSVMEGDEDHRWTKRTQGVVNSIATKLKINDEIILNDLLNKASTRKNAAQKFYTLLVLKKWQAIDVRQEEPYGDIYITAGPQIAQTVDQK